MGDFITFLRECGGQWMLETVTWDDEDLNWLALSLQEGMIKECADGF